MIQNERGQLAVEAVLIIVVLFGITLMVSREFRENNLISNLISGPWQYLDGMVQNGVWKPAREGYAYHPGTYFRRVSLDAEKKPK